MIVVLAMMLSIMPVAFAGNITNCNGGESCTHQAAIENTHYDTLQEAVVSVAANSTVTITLLRDCEGGQIVIPGTNVNLTIDFNEKTYTASEKVYGALFPVENEGNIITFKNGTINVKDGIDTGYLTYLVYVSKGTLNLVDMTLDGRNITSTYAKTCESYGGSINISGDTSIIAADGRVALSVVFREKSELLGGGPIPVEVNINTTGTIDGDIDYKKNSPKITDESQTNNAKLTITSGTFTGSYTSDNSANPKLEDNAADSTAAVQQGTDTTHFGNNERIEEIIEEAQEGSSFTALKIPEGMVINVGNGKLEVGGGSYTVPADPAPAPTKSSVPGVSYECGNTFKMETSKAPTAVLVDGVSVPFSADGKTLYVNVSGGNHWMTVEWMSTTYTFNFTCNDACQIVEVAIPKTGDMPIWAAIAAVFGF